MRVVCGQGWASRSCHRAPLGLLHRDQNSPGLTRGSGLPAALTLLLGNGVN